MFQRLPFNVWGLAFGGWSRLPGALWYLAPNSPVRLFVERLDAYLHGANPKAR
jgi:hypothetical protein